jgi:hypothetical protein
MRNVIPRWRPTRAACCASSRTTGVLRRVMCLATVLILCGSAGGIRPAAEQARQERDDRVERRARLDAQVIMVAMDAARLRAALLARIRH